MTRDMWSLWARVLKLPHVDTKLLGDVGMERSLLYMNQIIRNPRKIGSNETKNKNSRGGISFFTIGSCSLNNCFPMMGNEKNEITDTVNNITSPTKDPLVILNPLNSSNPVGNIPPRVIVSLIGRFIQKIMDIARPKNTDIISG